jgi:hypothetical protein
MARKWSPDWLKTKGSPQLGRHHLHEFLDRRGALLQCRVFLLGELHLEDSFDALRAKLDGHTDKEVVNAVLALQVGGAGQDALAVQENGFHHFDRRGRGGVVGAAGLEIPHDLGAAIARTCDDLLDSVRVHQIGQRNACYAAVPHQGNHGIPMAAKHKSDDVRCGDIERLRYESAEAGGVEYAGHAHHTALRKAAGVVRNVAHGVKRVGDHEQDCVRRVLHCLFHGCLDDVVIGPQQVIAAHSRLARKTGGENHDIGVLRGPVIVAAGYLDVDPLDRAGLKDVEGLALRDAFQDIYHDNVGQSLPGQTDRATGTDISRSYNCDLLSHIGSLQAAPTGAFILPAMAAANSLVFSLTAPSIWRCRS